MLGDKQAVAVVAVKDMDVAKKFYEETLGLAKDQEDAGGILFKSGGSGIFVYKSDFAGTNKATAISWDVGDDIQSVVEALKAKDVTFEHYDFPDTTREGDVHVMGKLKSAWFKDPDGNILNIVSGM